MSLFSFIGDAVDFVGDFFGAEDLSGQLVTAGIKTAGEFIIGGPSGQQQQPTQRQPVSKVAGGMTATSRVPRPDVPGPPGTVDVDTFHAEWIARMRKFSELASVTNTGQIRRS